MDLDDAIAELSTRLAHYPPARYPVQHATTQFHLGQALLQGGQTRPAITALRTSMQWFPEAMAVERAKVLNLLGAALRSEGHLQMAAAAFTAAGTVFAEHDLSAEHGAVLFNLGLVQRDNSDPAAAAVSFAAAQEQFAGGPPAPQAAAATHRGKALLEAGRIDDAAGALAQAVELAQQAGDREGVGVASNALGLAHHAAGCPREAVTALRLAVASHPSSVRPAEFAMAKANLALAYEALGLPAHARMAAHQALAAAPPAPVHEQAASLLSRLGPSAGSDLLVVLDDEPMESWATTVREELVRWAALSADERRAEARTWIDGLAQRPEHSDALVHVWLSALIELPPSDLDGLVRAVLEAARNVDLDEWRVVRSKLDRAMAWFPVPQMMRLRDRFEQTDGEPGEEEPCNPRRT